MSNWKKAFRSFYYETAEDPEDIVLPPEETALLVIDIQNTYLEVPDDAAEAARWQGFRDRMHGTVIPNTRKLIDLCRGRGCEVIYARIAQNCICSPGKSPATCIANPADVASCFQSSLARSSSK